MITTLGFRGEALPSIASVSRLFLRTKTERDNEGTEVEFNGGKLVDVRDIAWPGGSEIEVKDLFFNIPARRKFLKSEGTKAFTLPTSSSTTLWQTRISLSPRQQRARCHSCSACGRDLERAGVSGSWRRMLGKLVEVNHEAEGLREPSFVSNPQERRSSRDAQYFS